MKLKISKQGVGLCLLSGIVAGSLFLGCSSDTFSDNEFKPSNEMEERAYKLLKEKYPNAKVLSYEFIDRVVGKKEREKGEWEVGKFKEKTYSKGFSGSLYVETLDEFKEDNEKYTQFHIDCDSTNCSLEKVHTYYK
ncbi:MAG: hypothetical protein J1E31_07445 [Helicobacter sp.]|nr:hypothetical protein [Helicobacter sp.]